MTAGLRVPLDRAPGALTELWASQGGTVRLSAGTLLIACDEAGLEGVQATLDRLAETLPCRSVVIVLDESSSASLEAEVRLVRHGTGAVCERLIVRADRERAVGAALPLTVPDMPARLWWTLARPPSARVLREVAGDEVVIVDSRDTGLAGLGPGRRWWDLAWGRLGAWREAVASPFDDQSRRQYLSSLDAVAIAYAAGADGDARLISGWLASRLGWTGGSQVDGGLLARTAAGDVSVSWQAVEDAGRRPGELIAVELRSGGWSGRLERQPAGPLAVVELQPEGVTWRTPVEAVDAALELAQAFAEQPPEAWELAVERLRGWGLA